MAREGLSKRKFLGSTKSKHDLGLSNHTIVDDKDQNIRNFKFSANLIQSDILESVKKETRNTLDAAGNTGQFLKYLNFCIESQTNKIEKIKKLKEKFDHEVKILQLDENIFDHLKKKPVHLFNSKQSKEQVQKLLLDKQRNFSQIGKLRREIEIAEIELYQKEKLLAESLKSND